MSFRPIIAARVAAVEPDPKSDRYAQCDETCTSDCGACKGRREESS